MHRDPFRRSLLGTAGDVADQGHDPVPDRDTDLRGDDPAVAAEFVDDSGT